VRLRMTATHARTVTFVRVSSSSFPFTPSRAPGETLDLVVGSGSGGTSVSSPCLEALSRLSRESLEGSWSQRWRYFERGSSERYVPFDGTCSTLLPLGLARSCHPLAFCWEVCTSTFTSLELVPF
jgi:hypothetical protein